MSPAFGDSSLYRIAGKAWVRNESPRTVQARPQNRVPCGIAWSHLNFNPVIPERNADALEPVKIRSLDEIKEELKKLFVENLSLEDLKPEDIKDDMELFGETGIGLDSLDGVEIVVLLRRQYGLDVKAMQKGRDIFRSINTLAPYVLANATK